MVDKVSLIVKWWLLKKKNECFLCHATKIDGKSCVYFVGFFFIINLGLKPLFRFDEFKKSVSF